MDYLPIFADLRDRKVVVVGGGERAAQKLRLLARTAARLLVLAAAANREIAVLAQQGRIVLEARPPAAADFADCVLVFAASEDEALDSATAALARAAGVQVNVVDRPALSSFIMPAIVDRDPIVVAVSSAGQSPLLARSLRAKLESLLPARLGAVAGFAAQFRDTVKRVIPDAAARRRFWEKFIDSPTADAVLDGDDKGARAGMLQLLNSEQPASSGVVYLVGAGLGDADLLTFRALRLMQQADVVLHDELVSADVLDRVRRDAGRIPVGKSKGRASLTQDEINALMLREASAGRRVLRLKGGDPFLFGRGGEEMEFLRAHGVDVVVAPGVTAALGAPAYAGIPLTHRDHASSAVFITGHTRDGLDAIDWRSLAAADRTLVVYMGLSNAGEIAARLIAAGLNADTPAALVQNGTRPDQYVGVGTLAILGALAEDRNGKGPALLVIGSVVTLSQAWTNSDSARSAPWRKR